MGSFYSKGIIFAKDDTLALKHFKLSADSGYSSSQVALGLHHLATTKNTEIGLKLLRTAANKGDADAFFILGNLYSKGLEVKKDNIKAYKMISLVKENKLKLLKLEKDSKTSLKTIKEKAITDLEAVMNQKEISSANKLIKVCRKKKLQGCIL